MKMTQQDIRTYSRLGPRAAFGQAVHHLGSVNPNVVVVAADLGNSSGLERFRKSFPDRFVNVGIAEQNMIGVAAGIAKEGYTVFASSFAPFISMRASEQVRMNLGYMGLNVKAVAIGSGLSMSFLGNSHYGLEDLAIMRTIPGLTIISPADCTEVAKAVSASAELVGPVFLRLTGDVTSRSVYEEDYNFVIGRAIELRTGTDVALIATGSLVRPSLDAATILSEHGVSCTVLNMHTIKPLDERVILDAARAYGLIFTLEEHSSIGGLGSAVADFLSPMARRPRHLNISLPDAYSIAGEYSYLLEYHGLTPDAIARRVLKELEDHPSAASLASAP